VIVQEATAEECLAFGEIGSKRKRVQLLLDAAPVDDQLWSESSLVVVDDREFPLRLGDIIRPDILLARTIAHAISQVKELVRDAKYRVLTTMIQFDSNGHLLPDPRNPAFVEYRAKLDDILSGIQSILPTRDVDSVAKHDAIDHILNEIRDVERWTSSFQQVHECEQHLINIMHTLNEGNAEKCESSIINILSTLDQIRMHEHVVLKKARKRAAIRAQESLARVDVIIRRIAATLTIQRFIKRVFKRVMQSRMESMERDRRCTQILINRLIAERDGYVEGITRVKKLLGMK
jgi:hypothetical protein